MAVMRLVFVLTLVSSPSMAFGGAVEEANAAVDRWAAAFSANDAAGVVGLYTADAVLLGTVSPSIAQGTDAIRAYFSRLPGSGNTVTIGERRTIVVGDAAVVSTGFYDFAIMRDGQAIPNPSRFTFLLLKRDGQWLIAHHHSSFRPKPPQ
jgi:uncharacterized protein (TIGR02246 family)